MNNTERIKTDIERIKKNKKGANFITIHSVKAIEDRDEITFVRCNIPFSIDSLIRVAEIYNNSENWYIQIHTCPYSTKVVIN